MNAPTLNIRQARSGDAATVANLVADAFHPLDVCQWLIPDDADRAAVLPGYFAIVVEHALTHGTVHLTTDLAATAVWLPVPHPDIPDYDQRLTAACGAAVDRFQALDDAMHTAHPTNVDHDYLAFLAVQPARQGQGYGTALLRHHLAVLDHDRRPGYLEASNTRSRTLYARHGFVDCAPTLDLPYTGERMYPMWRAPATSTS